MTCFLRTDTPRYSCYLNHLYLVNVIRIWSRRFWFHWGSVRWTFSLILQTCCASSQTLRRSPTPSYSWSRGHWTSHTARNQSRRSGRWGSKSNPYSPGKGRILKGICEWHIKSHSTCFYIKKRCLPLTQGRASPTQTGLSSWVCRRRCIQLI